MKMGTDAMLLGSWTSPPASAPAPPAKGESSAAAHPRPAATGLSKAAGAGAAGVLTTSAETAALPMEVFGYTAAAAAAAAYGRGGKATSTAAVPAPPASAAAFGEQHVALDSLLTQQQLLLEAVLQEHHQQRQRDQLRFPQQHQQQEQLHTTMQQQQQRQRQQHQRAFSDDPLVVPSAHGVATDAAEQPAAAGSASSDVHQHGPHLRRGVSNTHGCSNHGSSSSSNSSSCRSSFGAVSGVTVKSIDSTRSSTCNQTDSAKSTSGAKPCTSSSIGSSSRADQNQPHRQQHEEAKAAIDFEAMCPNCRGRCEGIRVLDVGTGSGVLALMMAQKLQEQPAACVHAIDIDAGAVAQARANAAASPWAQRISVHHASIQEWVVQWQQEQQQQEEEELQGKGQQYGQDIHGQRQQQQEQEQQGRQEEEGHIGDESTTIITSSSREGGGSSGGFSSHSRSGLGRRGYDLIITNPPFFLQSSKPAGASRKAARHADGVLPFSDTAAAAAMLLDGPGGVLSLILPPTEAAVFEKEAAKEGLTLTRRTWVFTKAGDKEPKRLLMQFQMRGWNVELEGRHHQQQQQQQQEEVEQNLLQQQVRPHQGFGVRPEHHLGSPVLQEEESQRVTLEQDEQRGNCEGFMGPCNRDLLTVISDDVVEDVLVMNEKRVVPGMGREGIHFTAQYRELTKDFHDPRFLD